MFNRGGNVKGGAYFPKRVEQCGVPGRRGTVLCGSPLRDVVPSGGGEGGENLKLTLQQDARRVHTRISVRRMVHLFRKTALCGTVLCSTGNITKSYRKRTSYFAILDRPPDGRNASDFLPFYECFPDFLPCLNRTTPPRSIRPGTVGSPISLGK